jgi:signal transduction histidine kinase
VGFVYVAITATLAEEFFQERNQLLNASIADHIISEVKPVLQDGELTASTMDEIMHHMMAINPTIEVYILDPEGKIINYVVPYKKVKMSQVRLEPIREFMATEGKAFIQGDDPRKPGEVTVFSAAPIKEENNILGYVYVVLASEEFESAAAVVQESYILTLGSRVMVLTILCAAILGAVAIWIITTRLNTIITSVKRFQNGEMSSRINVTSERGGLNDLAVAFNEMADTIVGNIENLKSMENLRRELVGNVSHDLRTPLSVIHGYIETLMIKSETLEAAERDQYLSIILASTEKLKTLVNELFELSKLEAKQVTPKKEPFIIQELIHDICQKFELLSQKKNVTIRSDTEGKNRLVLADVSLIERVLQNLIDNALKFTPEGGVITIAVSSSEDTVEIRVSDTGPGIPAEQIPFIFDRYHIGDKRITLDQNNTGLGLAIVKKILEIHNSSIELHSRLQHGTTFAFSLPNYKIYA